MSRPKVHFGRQSVIHNGSEVRLSRQQFYLFLMPYMRGRVVTDDVAAALYGDDPDGGALDSLDVVQYLANRRLSVLGLRIRRKLQLHLELIDVAR